MKANPEKKTTTKKASENAKPAAKKVTKRTKAAEKELSDEDDDLDVPKKGKAKSGKEDGFDDDDDDAFFEDEKDFNLDEDEFGSYEIEDPDLKEFDLPKSKKGANGSAKKPKFEDDGFDDTFLNDNFDDFDDFDDDDF